MFWRKKGEKRNRRKLVALVDYENISRHAVELGKVVDFTKLHKELTEIGEIIFAIVFTPVNYAYSLPADLNNLGFKIVLCQKFLKSNKLEDAVDINIIMDGIKFCQFDEITDIVIVSQDRHMVHLASEAKNRKKKLTIYGLDQISRVLVQVVGIDNTRTLPLKNK